MAHILTVVNWLLPLLYLALLIDYGAAFFMRSPRAGRNLWLPGVVGLHVAFLAVLAVHLGRLVPANSFEVLSVLAASTTLVYWIVELASGERRAGVFILLTAFLLQYTASVFLPVVDLRHGAASHAGPAGFHVIPSLVAYTALTISAICGLLHLVARRNLKQHRFGLLFDRLPSLDILGTMCWHAMLVGFAFITAAVVSGAVMYATSAHSPLGGLSAKVWTKILAGTVAWVIYAGAVAGKWIGKWPVSRVCLVSVVGFLVVAVMLVASIVLS